MNKLLLSLILSASVAFGLDEISEVDCLIIKEENSIICKYSSLRETEDKFIDIEWVDPSGEISRSRKIIMPKGHGSVYDFRYIQGRKVGVWTFKAKDGDKSFSTEFEITNDLLN